MVRIVVLTGAGISAESGLATFRDSDGLWEGHRVDDVATPEGFAADPVLVQTFYDLRRVASAAAQPNAAHRALAELEAAPGVELLVVTQNVDDLHERAGTRNLIHMHGELMRARCTTCGERPSWTGPLVDRPPCPHCGEPTLRPDIVWFGEMPYAMDDIAAAVERCDIFAAIGTSGVVYPAAGLAMQAAAVGARTVEINPRPTRVGFDQVMAGTATEAVPVWVEQVRSVLIPATPSQG